MGDVVHLDRDVEGMKLPVAVEQREVDDVGPVRAEDPGHRAERSRLVLDDNREACGAAVAAVAPGEIDPVGIGGRPQLRTIDHMHLDCLLRPAHADDAVARQRVAAGSEGEGDARRQPLHRDRRARGGHGRRQPALARDRRGAGHQRLHHRHIGDGLARDRLHQPLLVAQLQPAGGLVHRIGADLRGQARDDLVEEFAAERDRLDALLLANEAADARARLGRGDERRPAGLRLLRLRSQDLDLIAIGDLCAERHHLAVDLGAHRLVAEIGVDGIGEVDRGGALGQLDQLARGGEGEDPILVHRHPGRFEQLLGRFRLLDQLDEVADPGGLAHRPRRPRLVGPMRGKAVFGLGVHLLVADLDLDAPLRMDHRGVEGAVAVALGGGDVILEAAGHHRPAAVKQPQRAIALLDIVDDHAERHHIGQLLEADVAARHLAPDRIGMLLAPLDRRLDARAAEQQAEPRADARHLIAAAGAQLLQPAGDRRRGLGLELAEGERLHLLHKLVHADPLGQRGVDVHRLAGDAAALLRLLDVVERAHVVEPVGELHQEHADVIRHGEQELAHVLGGALALGLRLDLRKLGDAVDQARHGRPEALLDLLVCRHRILDRVVEDGGGDRLVVEVEVGEDARHLDRVAEIRIARGALLAAVRLHREDVGAIEQRLIGIGVVAQDPIDQLILSQHGGIMGVRGGPMQAWERSGLPKLTLSPLFPALP